VTLVADEKHQPCDADAYW